MIPGAPHAGPEEVERFHRSTATDWLDSHGPLTSFATTGTIVRGLDTEILRNLRAIDDEQFADAFDHEVERARLLALLEYVEADIAVLQAEDIGVEHGQAAADWWVQDALGGRATGATESTARQVLRGIEDGDPAVLDALPGPHSDYGPDELDDDCGWEEPGPDDQPAHARWQAARPRLWDAYQTALNETMVDHVEAACWEEINNADLQRFERIRLRGGLTPASRGHGAVGL